MPCNFRISATVLSWGTGRAPKLSFPIAISSGVNPALDLRVQLRAVFHQEFDEQIGTPVRRAVQSSFALAVGLVEIQPWSRQSFSASSASCSVPLRVFVAIADAGGEEQSVVAVLGGQLRIRLRLLSRSRIVSASPERAARMNGVVPSSSATSP